MYKLPVQKNMKAGFTLIETLIAILIFSIALTGLSTIASRGIAGTRGAANEITAQYLAQEGVEAVRHIRDSNYASIVSGRGAAGWLDHIIDGNHDCDAGEDCVVYYDEGVTPHMILENCGGPCPPLLIDRSELLYGYDTSVGDPTPFVRTIVVTDDYPDEIEVRSSVSWNEGRVPHNVTATEVLTHWQNI